ncbi:hypothetical protein [Streptomyces sp. NPDC051636]|uniref:hypothetical protein n=1 Tax=Streptomyces sp. NPDC051636 TaxID=3365663 RepID=UPI0037A83064
MVLGLAAAAGLHFPFNPDRWSYWLAGPVFGACILASVLVGELRVPRPDGAMRTALLMPRRVGDYLPRRYGPLLGALVLALTALLTVAAIVTSSHTTKTGGSLRFCSNILLSMPMWPNLPTAVVMFVSVVGGAGACLLVVREIATRPVLSAEPAQDAVDNALRTASAEAVTLAWGCLVASSLLSSAVVTAYLLDNLSALTMSSCTSPWLMPSKVAAYTLVAGSSTVLAYLFVRLRRLPLPRRAVA